MPALIGGLVATFAISNINELRNYSLPLLFSLNIAAGAFLAAGFIPTTVYSLLCGYIFGWISLPFILLSYLIACALGYWACNLIENGNLLSFLEQKYDIDSYKKKLESAGIGIVALCRLSPALPFAILNAVFAMTKFHFKQFMVGSLIGMIPRTALAVYVGSSFTSIHSVDDLKSDSSLWIALIFAGLSFVGIGVIIKRKFA